MNWEAWSPAIVTLATAIFIAGSYSRTVKDHDKRLDGHDVEIKDLDTRMTASEAWADGYKAGRAK